MDESKDIILGIDGIPYNLMDDLSDKGVMPNFQKLKEENIFTVLKSSIPHISSVSWSSIITGKNPGEHGIYGFTDIIDGTYSLQYPNFNALKSKPFWKTHKDTQHVIINVPMTYPVREMNGVHIAGFVALDLEKSVFPKNLIPILKEMNYQIDVDTKIAKKQSMDQFFKEVFSVLEIRKNAYQLLWDKYDWDTFMFIITGSDRLGHYGWHIYENKSHNLHGRFLEFFKEIDEIIGEIVDRISEDDTLIILSDHGMEKIRQNVNLNTYLHREGFLNLSPSESLKRYNRLTKDTKAFVLDPGRVYLNRENKYPRGSVKEGEIRGLLEDLKEILYDLEYQDTPVIKKIYEKEEIYHGHMIHKAPDLICIEYPGFRLKGAIGREKLFEKDIFSGKHNAEAFILTNKKIASNSPSVEDIVNLLTY